MLVPLVVSSLIVSLLLLSRLLWKSHRAYKTTTPDWVYDSLPVLVIAKVVVVRTIIDTIGTSGLVRCKTAILSCQRLLSSELQNLSTGRWMDSLTFWALMSCCLIVRLWPVFASAFA